MGYELDMGRPAPIGQSELGIPRDRGLIPNAVSKITYAPAVFLESGARQSPVDVASFLTAGRKPAASFFEGSPYAAILVEVQGQRKLYLAEGADYVSAVHSITEKEVSGTIKSASLIRMDSKGNLVFDVLGENPQDVPQLGTEEQKAASICLDSLLKSYGF